MRSSFDMSKTHCLPIFYRTVRLLTYSSGPTEQNDRVNKSKLFYGIFMGL